jgi:competence protein ComEC
MLDVGQGLAILVETENHLLLYDTGPGDNQSWSLVSPVISPAITSLAHSAPERLIVSHGDLDHAGGLSEVQNSYPSVRILANLRAPGSRASIPG